jgi:hypothetical protein
MTLTPIWLPFNSKVNCLLALVPPDWEMLAALLLAPAALLSNMLAM